MIGQIGIHDGPGGTEYELGYWLAREHWGKGYATEAANAVLDAAAVLGIREVEGGHFIDNAGSGHVLQKCGFVECDGLVEMNSLGRGESVQAKRFVADLRQRPIMQVAA